MLGHGFDLKAHRMRSWKKKRARPRLRLSRLMPQLKTKQKLTRKAALVGTAGTAARAG